MSCTLPGLGESMKKIVLAMFVFLISVKSTLAHCPLCTAGAAAAAGGALWLGVDKVVIGLFIGAFAVSTGWWVGKLIKKEYIPHQRFWIIILSFVLTVIPIYPILSQVYPLFISWGGEYGSIFNRTYVFNLPIISSVLGGIIVSIAPFLSKKISSLRRGKMIPFQGVTLTLILLVIVGTILQVMI